MSIVQAGKTFTATDVKSAAGNIASHLRDHLQQAENFRAQLASFADADLVTLGLTQDEVDAIKGVYIGDLPAIRTSFLASGWLPKVLGLGV